MDQAKKWIHCDGAYRLGLTGKGVVAVLDTGIFPHRDFENRIVVFNDMLKRRFLPYDDNGHGTHISGIIGGKGLSSDGRYQGVAPECSLISVKVLDQKGNGFASDVLSGLKWVERHKQEYGIRIINISVGSFSKKGMSEDSALVRGVDAAWDAGFVVVVAAGNNGPGQHTITTPGISRKVITVGCSDDYKEVDVHHRHVSHLYGLHPGNLISPESTPELAEACRMTLNRRGDEGTGWSRAWKINFWARLGDGNRAWKLFKSLLHPAVDAATGGHGSGTFPNLFCSHPPFQIDGNYGGAAGVGEMLLQSHEGFIHLLPALPDSWTAGNFRGMRVRGGASIDLDWKDGRATRAVVTALVPGKFILKMPAGAVRAQVKIGGRTHTYKEPAFPLDLNKGEAVTIHFL